MTYIWLVLHIMMQLGQVQPKPDGHQPNLDQAMLKIDKLVKLSPTLDINMLITAYKLGD